MWDNINDEYHKEGYFWSQIFINIIFFLAINTVCLNIFFGIIVDTFGDLRNQT
jgi:hypothetical protein